MRIFLFFLVLFSFSLSQGQELYHRILNSDNGLPSNKVHTVFEDSKGYIWFGTENGVCRWDSKNFITYTIKDGLPNNEVLVINEDSKGRIWFSTFSNELCYLQNDTIFNRKNDKRLEKINIIKGGKLFEHQGEIYYFNYPSLLPEKFNIQTLENKKEGIKSLAIGNTDIFSCKQSVLFSATNNETSLVSSIFLDNMVYSFHNWAVIISPEFKYDFKLINYSNKKFYNIPLDSFPCFMQNHSVNSISFNKYISDISNLTLTAKQSSIAAKKLYTPNPIINKPNCGIKFLGEFNGDLRNFHFLKNELFLDYRSRIQSQNGSFIPLEFLLNHAKIINHKLAIITDNNALLVTNTKVQNIKLPHQKQSPIYKLFLWNNELNILYQNGMKYNLANKSYAKLDMNRKLYNLDRGEKNELFLTSYDKIVNLFNGEVLTIGFPYFSSSFKGFSYSAKHNLYTICNSSLGLYTLDFNRKSTKISDLNTYTSFIDNRDRLWIGTINKLYVTNTFSPKVTREKEVRLNPKFDVFCSEIKEDGRGNIFFTTNDGIYILDKNDKKYHIYDKNYLSSNECVTLKLDTQNQSFFVATRNGVNNIHYLTRNGLLEFFVVNKLFKDDGLGSNEIADILIHGDSLWIATAIGLNLIVNKNYRPDTTPISININAFKVNDSLLDYDTNIRLSSNQTNLEIDFSAIYYLRRDRLAIQYLLIRNGDTSQYMLSETKLRLNALKSGDYELIISAYDIDYPYNNGRSKSFKFTIDPPFYQTWWFYLLILLGLAGLAYLVYKRKLDRLRELSQFEKKFSLLKLEALKAEMNPHFIFNCLSAIKDYVMQADIEKSQYYLDKLAKLIRLALYNSKDEFISLGEEIQFIDTYIELERMRFDDKFDFIKEFDLEQYSHIQIPTMILQPFIENAIRHGKIGQLDKQGKLYLSIYEQDDYLVFDIRDNGIGYEESQKLKATGADTHRSMAMDIIQERIAIYNRSYQLKIRYEIRSLENNDYKTQILVFIHLKNL